MPAVPATISMSDGFQDEHLMVSFMVKAKRSGGQANLDLDFGLLVAGWPHKDRLIHGAL